MDSTQLLSDHGSPALMLGFCGLVAITLGAGLAIARRWAGIDPKRGSLLIGLWMVFTGLAAQSGILASWDFRPPPAMLLFAVGLLATIFASRTAWARRLASNAPIAALVGFHAFRLPLEVVMHRAYSEGIMPVQMSYSGRNFDIATGILAVAIGLWATRAEIPRGVLWAFNGLGLGLLLNIVGVAIASMPVFAAFGPDRLNVWVTWLPYVWLPTVFVLLALFGHLMLFRRLFEGAPSTARG